MAILFTLLTNCVPDPSKFGTGGPKMSWVFFSKIAESTKTRVLINLNAVSFEPAVSSDELDKMAERGSAQLGQLYGVGQGSREPLLCLMCIGQ